MMAFAQLFLIYFLFLTCSKADQSLDEKVSSLVNERMKVEWEVQRQQFEAILKQKLDNQRLEFEAKLAALENSCQAGKHMKI